MKKVHFLCVILSVMVTCVSCKSEQPKDDPECDGCDLFYYDYTAYVYSYTPVDTMHLIPSDQIFDFGYMVGQGLYNEYGMEVLFETYDAWYDVQITRESNKTLYDSLCIKHNDLSYNRRIGYYAPTWPHNYLAFDLLSIQIISNADFDEHHPAGTPLNDIVQFIAYTPYPFIQGGYQYVTPDKQYWFEEITLINKPLSECTQEDFILTLGQRDNEVHGVFPCCYLTFNQVPTLAQQHTFTVTITDDTPNTWEASINMNWNK